MLDSRHQAEKNGLHACMEDYQQPPTDAEMAFAIHLGHSIADRLLQATDYQPILEKLDTSAAAWQQLLRLTRPPKRIGYT